MKVKFIKYMMHVIMVLVCTCLSTPCGANVTFTNFGTSFLLNATNSKLYVNNPAKVTGWGQHSIVKAYGDIASSSWSEGYAAGSIIGQTGASSVTKPTRTNLVDANSNAINTIGGNLLRTTSNLLLYTARTYSSSLFVVRSRADSSSRDIRTTSNAVNMFYNNLSVPTTDSIDGTQFMRYHTAHHVFHNNGNAWSIRGWVRFNDGFTVMPWASVLMDTLVTVSGGFDLRDTGTLILNNDLYLAHNVTLTNGGNIKGKSSMTAGGQANTIFMGGDLTLASTTYARTLHITGDWLSNANSGDLIIDGCGHTLYIQDRAQIFVDQNITLTLRNMTIKTGPKSINTSAIQLASHGSKLALDNVMFDLGADFQFKQGQIFIHNEVAVTGTSAFVYTSPKPSYITSGATWSFETGTTFSIAPATYTDQSVTAGIATSNNFIVLADQSAALSLSNCSLKTTFTGARFTKGMVLFDNKVSIDTQAGIDISGLGSSLGSFTLNATATSVSVSPDGRYLAVIDDNLSPSYIRIMRSTGGVLTSVTSQSWSNRLQTTAWGPDGRFIAVGGINGSSVGQAGIYRFDGSTLNLVALTPTFGTYVYSVAWSPDGRYLAVGGADSTSPFIIYRFNGISLTQVVTLKPYSDSTRVNTVAWGANGSYVLLTSNRTSVVNEAVRLYSFDGQYLSGTYGLVGGLRTSYAVALSSDCRRMVWVQRYNAAGLILMARLPDFSGSTATYLGTQLTAASFSPDGRYLLVCGANSGAGIYGLYKVDLSGPTLVGTTPAFGTNATAVAWSPDSKYVYVGGNNGTTDLMTFATNITTPAANTQGFSNGLVFGDKAKGAAYDADVQVLGNATVAIKGMVRDDSA